MAITTEDLLRVRSMVRKLGLSFPVSSDLEGVIVSAFGLLDEKGRTRTATVLIDSTGRVRWVHRGRSSADHPSVSEILGRLEDLDLR